MKSLVVKRNVVIAAHQTSVSLEDAFWRGLKDIAGSLGWREGETSIQRMTGSQETRIPHLGGNSNSREVIITPIWGVSSKG
jgi:hypothetical protein